MPKTDTDQDARTLLTQEQVAARFGVSIRTVFNWMNSGELRYFKAGKVVRFYPESIIEFAKRKTVLANEDSPERLEQEVGSLLGLKVFKP